MKIVNFSGGIGNQMFQYALLVALRETFHDETLMDTSYYGLKEMHNGFELARVFNITAKEATAEQINKLSHYFPSYKLARFYWKFLPKRKTECPELKDCLFNPDVLTVNKDLYYNGIWQDYRYFDQFRDVILKEFSYREPFAGRNAEAAEQFSERLTVSLHVRRGDYLLHKNYIGLCGIDYYRRAIKHIRSRYGTNVAYAVFSDDMEWCRENLLPLLCENNVTYVDWNHGLDSYNDMRLMSACKVNVIANSSFSWWAAYLNTHEDKEVIAPRKWTNIPVRFDRQMPGWTLFEG